MLEAIDPVKHERISEILDLEAKVDRRLKEELKIEDQKRAAKGPPKAKRARQISKLSVDLREELGDYFTFHEPHGQHDNQDQSKAEEEEIQKLKQVVS
jgi:hypothetical protein